MVGDVNPMVEPTAVETAGHRNRPDIGRFAGMLGFALVVALLAWRITRGADLSDEAYYALFVDDWIKGGIRQSATLMLHQTAALVVYPIMALRHLITGSSDGMILALRGIFLLLNVAAGLCWMSFLRRVCSAWTAWAAAVAALAFIPFGLPAPSYNTLALQGLTIALAAFGAAQTDPSSSRLWQAASAAGWALATVAYPTLVLLIPLFLLVNWPIVGAARRVTLACMVLAAQAAAWTAVVIALGPQKLPDSFAYMMQFNDVADGPRKLQFALGLFVDHPLFLIGTLYALAIAIFHNRLEGSAAILAKIPLIIVSLMAPPALFGHGHDLVWLLALSGLHLLSGLRASAGADARLVGVLYLASLVAAALTSASAYHSTYNFCIGGAPAAILALTSFSRESAHPRAAAAVAWLGATTFLVASLTYFYGDFPNVTSPRQRIPAGPYAGLWVQPDQAMLLRLAQDQLSPLVQDAKTIVQVGRMPGLILATPARPLMPSTYSVGAATQAGALLFNNRFYSSHRADAVLVYNDVYLTAPNPYGERFADYYQSTGHFDVPQGTLDVYRLKLPVGG